MTTDLPQIWYPAATMRWSALPVWAAGRHYVVPAVVRRHEVRRLWWWFQVRAFDPVRGWVACEVPLDVLGGVGRMAPRAWAPLDAATFGHPLPEPLTDWVPPRSPGQVGMPVPADIAEDTIAPRHVEGWPFPGLALAERMPPATLAECEARLLRAYRTSAAVRVAGSGHGRRTLAADIPAEMVKAALKAAEAERIRAGDVTGSDFEAVRSAWQPSRRDLGDWDTALGWLASAECKGRRAVEMRAADPQFSFRQIGEALGGVAPGSAHALYRRTIEAAFAAASRVAP